MSNAALHRFTLAPCCRQAKTRNFWNDSVVFQRRTKTKLLRLHGIEQESKERCRNETQGAQHVEERLIKNAETQPAVRAKNARESFGSGFANADRGRPLS